MTIQEKFPSIRPSLNLDFANTKTLDPRVTFSRASTATYYDGKTVAKAEENLLIRSQEFDNDYWTKQNVTVTANSTIAPDGSSTSDTLIETAGANFHGLYRAHIPASLGVVYTYSVFVKDAGRRYVCLDVSDQVTGNATALFDLQTGTLLNTGSNGAWSGVSATINAHNNGFYRLTLTGTKGSGALLRANVFMQDVTTFTVGGRSYTGDGTSGIYIWGAQLEAGAFPTSYIPTTTSQVTRSADNAVMTGTNFSSWYRADEGSVFVESLSQVIAGNTPFSLDDGSVSNQIWVSYNAGIPGAYAYTRGAIQVQTTGGAVFAGQTTKQAFGFSSNNNAFAHSGSLIGSDTSSIQPIPSKMSIGVRWNNVNPINGHIRRLAYYPKRLTDPQLQAITT